MGAFNVKNVKKSVIVFLLLTVLFSAICWAVSIRAISSGEDLLGVLTIAVSVLMWCPGIAAIIVSKNIFPRRMRWASVVVTIDSY